MIVRGKWVDRGVVAPALSCLAAALLYQPVLGQCDPAELQQLLPTDIQAVDQFGATIAISDDFIMVGAPEEETEDGVEVGTVRIYRRAGGQWTESQTLAGLRQWDHFGSSIAIDGDLAVIGAPDFDVAGVNQIGSIFIYERDGTQWVEQRMMIPAEAWNDYRFGAAVAIRGDDLIVGAGGGRAHVYRRAGGAWNQVSLLEGNGELDDFGRSVAIAGDVALVGAPRDNQSGSGAGAVYAYARVAGLWEFDEKIIESTGFNEYFGWSLDLEPDGVAIIGAPGEETRRGAAYIFRRGNHGWAKERRLASASTVGEAEFGGSAAISGALVVVGAPGDMRNPMFPGSVFLYRFTGGAWLEQPVVQPKEGESLEHFGWSVAIADQRIAIGVSSLADLGGEPSPAYLFHANAGVPATLDSLTIRTGALVAGEVSRLRTSDDKRLSVRSEFTPGDDPPYLMILDIKLTTGDNNPALLHLVAEGKLNQNGGTAKLFAYDWIAGKWKRVARYSIGKAEKGKLVQGLDADRYIRDDGLIKVRIRQEMVTSSTGDPFISSTDQVEALVR